MNVIHKPNVGILIQDISLKWGMSRSDIRKVLNRQFEEVNNVHKISDYLPESDDITERKDIYYKTLTEDLWFALIYDAADLLKEFELHEGGSFIVDTLLINFTDSVSNLRSSLLNSNIQFISINGSEENILIPDLLTHFASAEEMGGHGKHVAYIYCSENIHHLLEEAL